MDEMLGFRVHLDDDHEAAIEKVTAALKEEGFGVLTSIDVQATLKEKLDADFRRYTILGACNPPLAYRGLQAEPLIGLLLPCNVTVEESEDGGSLVTIINPETAMTVGEVALSGPACAVATEARKKLERVVEALRA